MVGTVTEALKHLQAELATLLDAPTILALCREVGYQWRKRQLVQSPPSISSFCTSSMATLRVVTSCISPHNTLPPPPFVRRAPAYRSSSWSSCCVGQPRSAKDGPAGGAVAGPPPLPGRRVQFLDARYAGTPRGV